MEIFNNENSCEKILNVVLIIFRVFLFVWLLLNKINKAYKTQYKKTNLM